MSFDRVCNIICVGNVLNSLFQAILASLKSLVEKTTAFLMNIQCINEPCSDWISLWTTSEVSSPPGHTRQL